MVARPFSTSVVRDAGGRLRRMADYLAGTRGQCAWSLLLATDIATATGDGTFASMAGAGVWTEEYDTANSVDANGVFTVPDAGVYAFGGMVILGGLTSAHAEGVCFLSLNNGASYSSQMPAAPYLTRDLSGLGYLPIAAQLTLPAGMNVRLLASVKGGSKVVTLKTQRDASTLSRFWGCRVG